MSSFLDENQNIMLRQTSGIDIDPEINTNYKFIRSVLSNNFSKNDSRIDLESIINEIFTGFLKFDSGFIIEYFGNPATIVLNNSNVVIASQIFERYYSDNKEIFGDKNTFKEYFKKREDAIINQYIKDKAENKPETRFITWLGSPSIVYSYNNRNNLKKFFNNNPAIYLFFWPTSFNSTTCITKFGNIEKEKAENNITPYCDKYEALKQFCKGDSYQSHNMYSNYTQQSKDNNQSKFVTNFRDAITIISEEQAAIKNYNTENNKNYFQRYNETFTYFFPWDIDGIEIGNTSEHDLLELFQQISEKRQEMVVELNKLTNDSSLIENINSIIELILKQNPKHTKDFIDNNYESNYTIFLISKYILLSKCGLNITVYKLDENDLNNIKEFISEIIKILNEPLKIFEYTINGNDNFDIMEKGTYKNVIPKRESKFTLFEQKLDEKTKITNVSISDKQLNFNDENINEIINENNINENNEISTARSSSEKTNNARSRSTSVRSRSTSAISRSTSARSNSKKPNNARPRSKSAKGGKKLKTRKKYNNKQIL